MFEEFSSLKTKEKGGRKGKKGGKREKIEKKKKEKKERRDDAHESCVIWELVTNKLPI